MIFPKKLFGGRSETNQREWYIFRVKCRRCGEIIESRLDIHNDLSVEYQDGGDIYHCRKVLMGTAQNRCYQQIEVMFEFDGKRRLIDRRIESGGDFVE